jgi:hypothetical protein
VQPLFAPVPYNDVHHVNANHDYQPYHQRIHNRLQTPSNCARQLWNCVWRDERVEFACFASRDATCGPSQLPSPVASCFPPNGDRYISIWNEGERPPLYSPARQCPEGWSSVSDQATFRSSGFVSSETVLCCPSYVNILLSRSIRMLIAQQILWLGRRLLHEPNSA